MDQTIQAADADDDLTPLIRMQDGNNYTNMINDADLASGYGSEWENLYDDSERTDNAINSAEPGDQNALDQVAAASQQMGSECQTVGAGSGNSGNSGKAPRKVSALASVLNSDQLKRLLSTATGDDFVSRSYSSEG